MPKKKPPARRKRSAPQGAESHARKQERLEARRRAKEAALIAAQRRERRARAIRTATFVTVFLALIYFFFFRQTAPDEIAGNPINSFSTSNGGQQQTHTPPYNYTEDTTGVNPPVSGRHDPVPAECGTHAVRIPDENLVHSLEHGAVAILYDSDQVQLADIKNVEAIVGDYDDDVLTAPYRGLSDPIVVASWSRKMELSEFDEAAIKEYIDRFRDTEPAPEASGQDCEHDSNDVFEPEEEASPSPSPSPEPSPEDNPKDDKGGNAEGGSGESGAPGGDDNPSGDDGTADKGSGDNSKMNKEQKGN